VFQVNISLKDLTLSTFTASFTPVYAAASSADFPFCPVFSAENDKDKKDTAEDKEEPDCE
jgi:hypothetical protein